MIVPRYSPTFSYTDLSKAWQMCQTSDTNDILRDQLGKLYSVKYVFLFESARAALFALLKTYNHPGGVISPAYNCIAVPEAILSSGYFPQFVDIDIDSYNMTAKGVEEEISSKTSVVIITHQFGIPCEINAILDVCRRHKIFVVEDAAAAFGAKTSDKLVGCFGDAAIISFDKRKVLSGLHGGALLLNDPLIAQKIDALFSSISGDENSMVGFTKALVWKLALNSKLYTFPHSLYRLFHDEKMFEIVPIKIKTVNDYVKGCSNFASALVLQQLDQLNAIVNRRSKLAEVYSMEMAGNSNFKSPRFPENSVPAWIQFPFRVDDKKSFYNYMQKKGIDLSWTFKYTCSDSFGLYGFPQAKRASLSVLGFPTYPSLTDEQVSYVCKTAKAYHP